MDLETLVILGGAYHLAWVVFEALWPVIWNWRETLEALDDLQRLLPRLTSRGMCALYLGIAWLSLFRTSDLLATEMGRDVLVFVSAIWTARLGLQVWYFGLFGKANGLEIRREQYRIPFQSLSVQTVTNAFIGVFLFGITCYLVPLVAVLRS